MSVVKINAITVLPERAEEMTTRFAARADEVGKADGFEEFQLLRPTDDRTTWLVYTRWRDEDSFQAWMDSRAFGQAHGRGHGPGQGARHGPGAGATSGSMPPAGPVATAAELWNYHGRAAGGTLSVDRGADRVLASVRPAG